MNKERILTLLGNIVEVEKEEMLKLPSDTKIETLGISSIEFIQFIVAIEEEFQIEILDSDLLLSNFETIETLFRTLDKYFISNNVIKKVLICDCDNVLWHGIAGEESVWLDDATTEFQKVVEELYNRGVLICLCSKNQPENIAEAWRSLNMVLSSEHILISKINMKAKSVNILEIAEELNLIPDSFVFVDDNLYELDLVSSMIPGITTVQADYSNGDFITDIQNHFESSDSSSERSKQYKEQKLREADKKHYDIVEEFNASLNTHILCEAATLEQAKRLSELSQRTNQFNLSGNRYTEDQMKAIISDSKYKVITLSVSDKYGDMGIVGATIIQESENIVISDFYLSCRVFGRELEYILLDKAKTLYKKTLFGVYHRNGKNKRFENFYLENGVEIYESAH